MGHDTSYGDAGRDARPSKERDRRVADAASNNPPDGAFAQRAKAWSAVAFGFLAVLALALWLFSAYQAKRKIDLQQQFARSAARLSKQVELRYENDRQIIDNVTRVLASAQALATDQRRDLLNMARGAVETKEQWTKAALVRVHAANYLSRMVGLTQTANPDLKPESKLTQATTAASAWLAAANGALLSARAVPATQLRDAEYAVATKASTAGALQVEATDKASELDAATHDNSDAKKGALTDRVLRLDAARADLAQVEKGRSIVQATIVALQRSEQRAYKAEWQARQKALDTWHDWLALPDSKAVVRPDSTPEDWQLEYAFQDVEKNLASDLEADLVVANPLSTSDPVTNGREEARTFRARLKGVVLPSYRESLDDCPSNVGLRALSLCAARKISDLSAGTAAGVEVVECPLATDATNATKPASNLPSVSGDGQYLLLPGADADRAPLRICGRVRIDQLLAARSQQQSLVQHPQFAPFDAVALLRADGTALYVPDADSNVRLSSLTLEKGKLTTSSMVEKIALGGGEYRAFIQPVKIAIDAGGALANIVVAGFIPESTLTKQSMEIELSSYLWVVLLLGVGVLSLPLGKLWLLGENARFTNFDVTLLATSALLIILLSVVLLEGFVAHNRLWFRAGEQTKEVAESITKKLSTKMDHLGKGLDAFANADPTKALTKKLTTLTESSAQYSLSNECELYHAKSVDNVLFTDDFNRWSVCEFPRFDIKVDGGWNVAFLANSLGYQQAKFVPSDHASAPLSIASRGYFRDALRESEGCIDPGCVARGAAEVVRSAASGDLVLIAAKHVLVNGTQTGVAGIETSLDEFRGLVLPLGFRAAVIDRDGTVMLHSEDDNAHGQSLFADLDDPTSLRAALATQTPSLVEVRYLGVPSRAYVQPLPLRGLGWSVLVFAPFNIVDVATTDMVLTTLLGFGGLLALVVILACVWLLLVRIGWICGIGTPPVAEERKAISFRPRGSYSEAYAAAGVWMLRWSTMLCAVAWLSEGWVPTTLLLAGNAFVAGWALLRVPGFGLIMPAGLGRFIDRTYARIAARRRGNQDWRTNTALSYTLCCIGLAAVFVVTPSTIAFAGSYDLVVETLVRAEQSHIVGEVGRHPDLLLPPKAACVKPTTNAAAFTSVIPSHDSYCPKDTAPAPTGLWCSLWPIPCLADYMPPLGCAETQTLGRLYRSILQPPEPPLAGDYDFRRSSSDLQVVWNDNKSAVSAVRLPTLRSFAFSWPRLITLVFAFAAFLTVGLATGYHSLRRLFFLELMGKQDPFWPTLLDSPGQKALVTFADPGLETALRKHGFVELPKDPSLPPPPKCVAPAFERWLLDEGLAARVALAARTQATVVLLSNADPMRRVSDASREKWASALAGYQVLAHSCPSQPPPDASVAAMTQTWLDCDPREQQVLAYLVLDGYPNPHASTKATIEHLVRRGILDCDSLTLANPEFETVIRQSVTDKRRRAWATSDTGSAWQAIRVPLSGAVVALFSAVAMSKPELGAATAVVPTLAASLPAVIKILLEMVSPKAG